MVAENARSELLRTLLRVAILLALLYCFLVSIGLLGSAFKLFGKGFAEQLIETASNPLVALFGGILATTLIQSSSTTTSIVVGLVGAGSMTLDGAIFVVMGANIGTSVTNTLVSLGHVTHGKEFKRAFAASTVHDFFNILAVLILFPLQYFTNFLGWLADGSAMQFASIGGIKFASPIKIITKPTVDFLVHLADKNPWPLIVVALILLFGSLRYIVKVIKLLVMAKVEAFFDTVMFKNAARAMLLGVVLTTVVQSSSITTSLVIPLAGAGILTLRQIFPYTLGANVGTTVTAILAALAVGEVHAVGVAFAHLFFNVIGIGMVWPVRFIRDLPVRLAEGLAAIATRFRSLAVVYILLAFYGLPALVIFWAR